METNGEESHSNIEMSNGNYLFHDVWNLAFFHQLILAFEPTTCNWIPWDIKCPFDEPYPFGRRNEDMTREWRSFLSHKNRGQQNRTRRLGKWCLLMDIQGLIKIILGPLYVNHRFWSQKVFFSFLFSGILGFFGTLGHVGFYNLFCKPKFKTFTKRNLKKRCIILRAIKLPPIFYEVRIRPILE